MKVDSLIIDNVVLGNDNAVSMVGISDILEIKNFEVFNSEISTEDSYFLYIKEMSLI